MSTESSFATKEQFETDAIPDVDIPRSQRVDIEGVSSDRGIVTVEIRPPERII